MKRDAIAIKEEDNVATALRALSPNDTASVGVGARSINVTVVEEIEFGHKFAIREVAAGDDILKYGEVIGRATVRIPAGAHAHVHNVESLRGRGDLA